MTGNLKETLANPKAIVLLVVVFALGAIAGFAVRGGAAQNRESPAEKTGISQSDYDASFESSESQQEGKSGNEIALEKAETEDKMKNYYTEAAIDALGAVVGPDPYEAAGEGLERYSYKTDDGGTCVIVQYWIWVDTYESTSAEPYEVKTPDGHLEINTQPYDGRTSQSSCTRKAIAAFEGIEPY